MHSIFNIEGNLAFTKPIIEFLVPINELNQHPIDTLPILGEGLFRSQLGVGPATFVHEQVRVQGLIHAPRASVPRQAIVLRYLNPGTKTNNFGKFCPATLCKQGDAVGLVPQAEAALFGGHSWRNLSNTCR
uniref:(northern house mosquito) hypothetical protein n=1 Tax=Culex pipiens TaxID=7175 RepID=A0A8D8IZE8_CULPI